MSEEHLSSQRGKGHAVLGLGAPILDLILRVNDAFIHHISGQLHGMEPISVADMEQLIKASGEVPIPVPGGSASNMLRGLSAFGVKCAVVGKVGNDERGNHYTEGLRKTGVEGFLLKTQTPTTTVLSLVEVTGARTMRTYMGASQELTPDELLFEYFEGIKLLHIEGYAFYNFPVVARAIELAKQAGAKVSLDLASFEVVRQFRDKLAPLLQGAIDIIFANHDEAHEITGEEPSQAVDLLAQTCEVAIVMVGKEGCWVKKGEEKIHHPAFVVEYPVDTTGAGDLFASGFLHQYLKGAPLWDCARVGSLTGAAVVQVLGAVIPQALWQSLLIEAQ
ncbi:MAG: hypothetical protein JSR80_06385 [Verrucomicrobia bacterium]|nr:hypothetical protein [Verrucomicrobiota bacterium]